MSEAKNTHVRVRALIEEARDLKSKDLDLSSYNFPEPLRGIPDEVFELPQLESLSLYGNKIREVPERIRNLHNLKYLNLSGNPITKVPDIPGLGLSWESYLLCRKTLSIQNVKGISIIIEYQNDLPRREIEDSQYRDEIALLPCLTNLHIGTAGFTNIVKPTDTVRDLLDNIGDLRLLESMGTSGLSLEEVPGGIRGLKGLRSLHFSRASLHSVPEW